MVPTVKCPTCARPVEWIPSSGYRPFCCERCKLIDLGEWATESYAIPVKPTDDFASSEGPAVDESSVPSDEWPF
ncbi:MAG: DNA gyrase inhibitor YacG [Methylococcaceae bacterium]|jgi:hypothetical protein|nr:DNA gyrase inhibitor YacG [Methylococcaceae bacterium]